MKITAPLATGPLESPSRERHAMQPTELDPNAALQLRGLYKFCASHSCRSPTSPRAPVGAACALLGPNGAGKSTTMKMLTGSLYPDRGQVRVGGEPVDGVSIGARSKIGYLPEGAPLYPDMTVASLLEFVGQARGLDKPTRKARIEEVVRQVHLEGVRKQRIETLSKGFKRRVGLAQALLHDPEVLVLDEPTDGLDPNQKHEVRQLIQAMATDKIIIVSTHILEEVSAVCSRAIIIARGRILADETPADLQAKAPNHNRIVITAQDTAVTDNLSAALKTMNNVAKVTRDADRIVVGPTSGQNLLADIALMAKEREFAIGEMRLEPGQLDDVFRSITLGEKELS